MHLTKKSQQYSRDNYNVVSSLRTWFKDVRVDANIDTSRTHSSTYDVWIKTITICADVD